MGDKYLRLVVVKNAYRKQCEDHFSLANDLFLPQDGWIGSDSS